MIKIQKLVSTVQNQSVASTGHGPTAEPTSSSPPGKAQKPAPPKSSSATQEVLAGLPPLRPDHSLKKREVKMLAKLCQNLKTGRWIFPFYWRVLGQLLNNKLYVAIEPDFDRFCHTVLGLPAGEGERFAADPDGYARRVDAGSVKSESTGLTSRSDCPDTPPTASKLTKPVVVPVGQKFEFHPLAEVFPPLADEEFQLLRDSIRQNGLVHPVILFDGKILDGRNRYKACELEGVVPRFEEFIGDAPAQFVTDQNLRRRDLTAGQRAAIAVELLPFREREASERKRRLSGLRSNPGGKRTAAEVTESSPERGEAREAAAKATGANPRYVSDMARIKREAPELHEQVKAGKLSVPKAKHEAAKSRHGQADVAANPVTASDEPFVVVLHEDTNRGGDHDQHLWRPLKKLNEYPNVAYFRLCEPDDMSSIGGWQGFAEAAVYCVHGGIPSSNLPEHPYQRTTCQFLTLSLRGEVPAPAHVHDQYVSGGLEAVLAMIKGMWPDTQTFFISPTAKTPSGWKDLQAESGSKSDRRVKS